MTHVKNVSISSISIIIINFSKQTFGFRIKVSLSTSCKKENTGYKMKLDYIYSMVQMCMIDQDKVITKKKLVMATSEEKDYGALA